MLGVMQQQFRNVVTGAPFMPALTGWGTSSSFGDGGPVYRVSNLNDFGAGSFRQGLVGGNKIIEFDVAGVAPVSSQINVTSPNITVRGSTAPGSGFKLQATPALNTSMFKINAPDIHIENIGFYQNVDSTGNVDNRDTISISTNGKNIVFSQCSFFWGADETVQIFTEVANVVSDITFQYCLIAEGLSQTGHTSGEHSKGILVGNLVDRVTVHHCLFSLNMRRNPEVKADGTQLVNNVIINNGSNFGPMAIGGIAPGNSTFDVVSNRMYGTGGSEPGGCLLFPPGVFSGATETIYASGNIGGTRTSNAQAEQDFFSSYGAPSSFTNQSSPHTDLTGMITHADVTNDDLLIHLQAAAGAHSWNRISPDARAIGYQPNMHALLNAPPEGSMY